MGFHFPDSRAVLKALWDRNPIAGKPELGNLTVYGQPLAADFAAHLPALQLISLPGSEAFIERTDRWQLDLYVPGDARAALVALWEQVVGRSVADSDHGLIDGVFPEVTPHPVPYASDRINLASAVVRTVVRAS